jgi:hypothetical protein
MRRDFFELAGSDDAEDTLRFLPLADFILLDLSKLAAIASVDAQEEDKTSIVPQAKTS